MHYISEHRGREAHLESKADGQHVSIRPSVQGSGSWMDANSRHHRENSLAFFPLLAIPGLCPSARPPLQTQGPSAPSTPFWCICPILFLVVVSLLTCLEPGTQSPQYDLDECLCSACLKDLCNETVTQAFEGRMKAGWIQRPCFHTYLECGFVFVLFKNGFFF